MKFAEFDLLESKVANLLGLHRDLVSENRRLRLKFDEQSRELNRLRQEREETLQLKNALLERLERLIAAL